MLQQKCEDQVKRPREENIVDAIAVNHSIGKGHRPSIKVCVDEKEPSNKNHVYRVFCDVCSISSRLITITFNDSLKSKGSTN